MKTILFYTLLLSSLCFGQTNTEKTVAIKPSETYVKTYETITQEAAFEMVKRATSAAALRNQKVSIAVLDASGTVILLSRGEGVGPHNTEAARRKAYTAVSTKTATLALLRKAETNPDTKNLKTLPELLLLSGGVPIWYNGNVIGSIGIAGGGGAEIDDAIAKEALLTELGFTHSK